MNSIAGIDAIRRAQETARLPGANFTIAFYQYNRTKDIAIPKLRVEEKCTYRAQLPQDEFGIDGDNFFLFMDKEGKHKTCYRVLWRFVGFPPDYKLRKINWLHND